MVEPSSRQGGPTTATPQPPGSPPLQLALLGLVAGAGMTALAASIAAHLLLFGHRLSCFDLLSWALLLLAVPETVLGVPTLSRLGRLPDRDLAGRLWRRTAPAPFALAGALLLLGHAALQLEQLEVPGALAMVSPDMRLVLLARGLAETRRLLPIALVDGPAAAPGDWRLAPR